MSMLAEAIERTAHALAQAREEEERLELEDYGSARHWDAGDVRRTLERRQRVLTVRLRRAKRRERRAEGIRTCT